MAFDPVDPKSKKVLITGVTGQVARPLVDAYAKTANVYAMGRYAKEEDRKAMEAAGATPVKADLGDPASHLPCRTIWTTSSTPRWQKPETLRRI